MAYSWIAQLDCGDGGGGCGLWADVTSFPVADLRMVSLEIWPHPSGRQRDAHGKITRYNGSGARASLWRTYDDYKCILTIFFHFFSFPILTDRQTTATTNDERGRSCVQCARGQPPTGALPMLVRMCRNNKIIYRYLAICDIIAAYTQ